jgi:hypothetical protein
MRSISIGVVVITLGLSGTLAAPPALEAQARTHDYKTELTTMVRELARYRARLRMSPDAHDADLWAWDGPFHTVMARLGEELGDGTHTEREVQRLMGAPDRRFRGGAWTGTLWVPSDETHLIYRWRGGHDYLYFIVKRGRVVGARWWSAGE